MGWSYGINSEGREVGYAVIATCDHSDLGGALRCTKVIDRGLAYCCGDMHDGGDYGCGRYFCYDHLYVTEKGQFCEECIKILEEENNEEINHINPNSNIFD